MGNVQRMRDLEHSVSNQILTLNPSPEGSGVYLKEQEEIWSKLEEVDCTMKTASLDTIGLAHI